MSLSATDNVGVTAYYASETSTTPSASATGWTSVTSTTSYSATVSFTLRSGSVGDNTKTVYVWFKDTAGNVSSSASDSITLASAPSAPTGVSATAGNGQVSISWTSVSGATSYNIYWSTTSGVTKTTGTKLTGGTSPYTHTGRTNGTTYYYVVTAVNSYGESSESSQVSGTPSDYQFVTNWGSQGSGDGQFDKPVSIAVDLSGNVYVADTGNSRIQKFNSNGTFITKWGPIPVGIGIAVDSSGNVYVADTYNHRIRKFSPQ